MIKASELRIGVSWLYWIDKIPVQFNGTHVYGEGEFGASNESTMPQVIHGAQKFHQVSWEDLSPIPLTPEILEKCGFSADINGHYSNTKNLMTHEIELISNGKNYYPIYIQFAELSCEDEQRVSLKSIQSVHQLQNLYFALTGEELEIKF